LAKIDDFVTTREIKQQPKLWEKTLEIIEGKRKEIDSFLEKANRNGTLRIIFTGAGSSSFVGETVAPYLRRTLDWVESIPTTDIITSPEDFLSPHIPTLLISCARSGNSPESVETVNLANKIVENIYHLVLTCNPEGSLALSAGKDPNSLLLLMPEDSNDRGFAMTGSFTTMVLASILIFGSLEKDRAAENVKWASETGKKILGDGLKEIKELASKNFERAVFLGSSSFLGLAKEGALKLLELTAGKIPCSSDSFLGFRHGPKSIINEKTMVFAFLSEETHPRRYELDLVRELAGEKIMGITTIYGGDWQEGKDLANINLEVGKPEDGVFLLFPYIIVAQLLAVLKSMELGINPDDPSPEGSLNRVVQGVEIYPLE